MYRQGPMRGLMALELLAVMATRPWLAPKRLRALSAYRKAQEHLREHATPRTRLAAAQVAEAAGESGLPAAEVERLVNDWMQVRPLKYLRACRASGLEQVLKIFEGAGVKMGVLSDYPAESKLAALGLGGRFSPVLCTTDPGINAFKPHPGGFLRACETWRLAPKDVLMIGDRMDVDAAGAAGAGMSCVIIGRRTAVGPALRDRVMVMPSFERLTHVLEPRG